MSNEFTKNYQVFDGSDRLSILYIAVTDAADGEPCLKVEFTYVGITSRVEKRKESEASWDATWDI